MRRSGLLEITLLGVPSLRWQGDKLALPSPKLLGMVSYLALQDTARTRKDLLELFWRDGKAANVRFALFKLRGLTGADDWLETCTAVRKFRASGDSSFDQYLSANPPSIGPGDPLYEFIEGGTRRGVFVAAAGNFGSSKPRQPGLMPAVVSVSAAQGKTDSRFGFSNSAEVMTPGGWLRLGDPFGRNGVGRAARGVILAGTSFAAPNVAVASVLDLTQDTVRCALEASPSSLAHGAYTDDALAAAVDTFCLAVP